MDQILGMVQQLPAQYRLVFNLYVFEELTHKEISAMLSITEGTSKSNLSRARRILQQRIKASTQHIMKIS
jgi:RNA polymerase sigma-70 factor (ECF subfamily)